MNIDITNVLNLYRSVVTAGHCLCGRDIEIRKGGSSLLSSQLEEMKCKPDKDPSEDNGGKGGVQNQITPQKNEIEVYAGKLSYRQKESVNEQKFIMGRAYVRSYETKKVENEKEKYENAHYDIGVITQPFRGHTEVPFYNKVTKSSNIAPICLGAANERLHACKITTVGWGARFTLYPFYKNVEETIKSIYSNKFHTCTTNGVGPKEDRYKFCDLSFLKKNNWKCRNTPPKEEDSYPMGRCEHFINRYSPINAATAKVITEGKLEITAEGYSKAQIYEFKEQNSPLINPNQSRKRKIDETPLECYKKKLFVKRGWCKVKKDKINKYVKGRKTDIDPGHSPGWGFCDTSCQDIKVMNII